MQFPRFWKLAQSGKVFTWGWSDVSAEDALRVARLRQERVFKWLDGDMAEEHARYGYPDRPMREQVLREIPGGAEGEPRAVITRNSYGCLVLNTVGLLFVDVDTPSGSFGDWFRSLFGKKPLDPQTALEQRLRARAEQWVAEQPAWRWRLYRTAAGVRLVATHRELAPEDPAVQQAFDAFGADRLYRRLCQHQRCFRARLTPKPWRCEVSTKPPRWPWADESEQAAFRDWEAEYLRRSLRFATCRFLGEAGTAPVGPGIAEIMALHDEGTQAMADLPLA